jgi:hypothetical protein
MQAKLHISFSLELGRIIYAHVKKVGTDLIAWALKQNIQLVT